MDDINYIKSEIKRRVSLSEIVGETIRLKRSGSGFIGCCPFHKEKTPSFHVYADGHYNCFGCGANGDVINFIEKRDGLSFVEALKVLAPRAGIYMDEEKGKEPQPRKRRKASSPGSSAHAAPDAAAPGTHPSQKSAPVDSKQRVQVPDTIPAEYVQRSISAKSVLISYLRTLFDEQSIKEMIQMYRLGATKQGGIIYWQIDTKERVRTGKIVFYDHTGHRIKKIQNDHPTWIHYLMRQRGLISQDWNLSQCLFGEHLLTEYPSAPIALVEAEKTAIIASMAFRKYGFIWLATGGMNSGFNADRLSVLANRKVIVFPDAGNGFNKWESEIRNIASTVKFRSLSFSYLMKDKVTADEQQKGIDIADWILNDIQASKQRAQDAAAPMVPPSTPGASSTHEERPLMPSPIEVQRMEARRPGSPVSSSAPDAAPPGTHPSQERPYEISQSKVLQSMIDNNPAIGSLCEKFGLEFVSETPAAPGWSNVLDPHTKMPEKCPF